MSKPIFDKLRTASGGVLSQAQVDAANQAISATSESTVAQMLGIAERMKISGAGIDLIRSFESLQLSAYNDGVGVWTIGFGTTRYPDGSMVKRGETCTREQAKAYMAHDLIKFENAVNDRVKVSITQNQYDALVSLAYNIGDNAFKSSTLLKKLNAGDYHGAADQFLVWNKGGGKVMQGLVNRRKAERALFLV